MLEAAQRAGFIPTFEPGRRCGAPGDASGGRQWCLPPLPDPTPDMHAAAEARVAEERAAWEALAQESRRRLRGGDRDRAV